MRLFVALQLNDKTVTALTDLIRRLRPYSRLHWISPQDMHLTLKYIGEWPSQRMDEIVSCLSAVHLPAKDQALNIPLAGLGFFPDSHRPRIFWAGVENTLTLRRLVSLVDSNLQSLGVAPEVRSYHPHLTLARVEEGTSMDDLLRAIEDLPSRDFGVLSPSHFTLFESIPDEGKSSYRTVAEFSFFQKLGENASYAEIRRSIPMVR